VKERKKHTAFLDRQFNLLSGILFITRIGENVLSGRKAERGREDHLN